MGHVSPDGVGLHDVLRHHRHVPGALLPLRAVPADDLDLRDADDGAGCEADRLGGPLMDAAHTLPPATYGLLAEFDTPKALVAAAKRTYEAGYRRLDTFSPYPIEEAWEAIGHHDKRLSLIVLCGGLAGWGAGSRGWRRDSGCRNGCTRSPTRSTSRASRSTAGRSSCRSCSS